MIGKKGIALETAVGLIIGVVFLVVVIYTILQSGLLSVFQAQLYGMMCTASSYARGIIIGLILSMWAMVSMMLEFIFMIANTYSAASLLKSTSLGMLKRILQQAAAIGGVTGAFAVIGILSIGVALTYVLILPMLSGIPLVCPSVTIDVGTPAQPTTQAKFLGEISSDTVDCWNMYGAGSIDPLIGLDPPNPRECRILEVVVANTTPISVSSIYKYMHDSYNKSWPLGDKKLFVYCAVGNGVQELGNNASTWNNKCYFNQSRIFIMFRDKHDYDIVSYGTAVCGGKITSDDFGDVKDAMVWCIEKL